MKTWLCALGICMASLSACEGKSGSECSGVLTRFRALAYSKSFATRFQLPAQSAIAFDPGVQAMAVRVSQDANGNALCSLDLYVDDTIAFAYPPGSEGRWADLRPESGPLFFASKLGDADLLATRERWLQPRMAFRTKGYSEQRRGIVQGGPIEAFYRGLLPGVNVVEFVVTCSALDLANAPAELWLLRAGRDGSEFVAESPSEETAIRIAVPNALLNAAAVEAKKAAKQPVNPIVRQQREYVIAR